MKLSFIMVEIITISDLAKQEVTIDRNKRVFLFRKNQTRFSTRPQTVCVGCHGRFVKIQIMNHVSARKFAFRSYKNAITGPFAWRVESFVRSNVKETPFTRPATTDKTEI